MRLAFSKGNSFKFLITPPLTPAGSAWADDSTHPIFLPPGEYDDEHAII
jgi:hypothetical protein